MAASVALAASPAVANPREALIDGNGGAGYVITDVVQNGVSNPNVINSTPSGALVVVPLQGAAAASAGKSLTVGADDTNTIFSNFAARGGDGSGAGAGLGGVFFVDDSHTLTLSNVTLRSNTAEGGIGGVGSIGGSMNGLVSPGTAGAGPNGANSDVGFANFDGGKGGAGFGGFNGGNADVGVGGQGGLGGAGSNGLAVTADTVLAALNVAYDTVQLAKTIKEGSDFAAIAIQMTALSVAAAAGVNAGGPTTAALAPLFVTLATQFTEMAAAEAVDAREELVRLLGDTAYLIATTVTAYQLGASGSGGDGGSGGTGGDGGGFFSGGIGGAGGFGGFAVGTSGAVGGGGGSGGAGGVSAFGAGGASGGVGGAGGASGAFGGVGDDYLDGDAGDGGAAGFGGGVGSNGDDVGGGGGSGFGGAIFVAKGGTLNIAGNALFADNYILGGSSDNDGEAGQAAGTDLFVMKGGIVNLRPGLGNTIRFEGSIADNSAASIDGASLRSGDGASIQIGGGGLVQFAGENSYSGTTFISGATLEADIGAGIHADSRITFNGTGTIGGTGPAATLSNNTAGVLLTSGDIVRRVGTALPNQVNWLGSGGFAAGEDGLTLNFGKTVSSGGQALTWGSSGFVGNGSTLIFGSDFGAGAVTLVNNVNLNGLTGRIAVYDNLTSDNDWAVMAGRFTNGTLVINSAGYSGTAYFTNQNGLSGLTVNNGTVSTGFQDAIGRMMDETLGGNLLVNAGFVDFAGPERLRTVVIGGQGVVAARSTITSGSINNAGSLSIAGEANLGNIANTGVISLGAAATTGNISNAGTISFNASANTGEITNAASGRLRIAAGGTVGNIANAGLLAASGAMNAGTITNSGTLAFLDGPTIAGNVTNTGEMALFGSSSLGDVQNQGKLRLGERTSVTTLANLAGGEININGDLEAAGSVDFADGGTVFLAGNITSGSTVTNDGLLVVVGRVEAGVERAAVRRIIATGFQDPTGIVDLGGLQRVANTLIIDQSGDSLYSGTIVGPGFLVKQGAGTLVLTGANSFVGGLTVERGGIDTTGGGTFADTLDITVGQTGRLVMGTADEVRSIRNAGVLLGNANLIVTDLNNTGAASFNGTTVVRGNASNAVGASLGFAAGQAASVAGSLLNAGTLVSGGNLQVSGAVSNAAGATMTLGAGGANRFATLTSSGTINAAANLIVTGAYVQNSGKLTATAGLSTGSLSGAGGIIDIGAAGGLVINQTVNGSYAGSIVGSSSVTKTGQATLTLAGAAGSFAPSSLSIEQGTVAVNGAGILDTALAVSLSAGTTLDLVAGNQTIRNLTGSGSLALNGNNLSLANGGNFSGTVSGSGNIQVQSGSFNLSSAINSTSGNFAVAANSTMNVAQTGTLNAPAVTVAGTLNVVGVVNAATSNVTGVLHLGSADGTVGGRLASTNTTINGGGRLSGVGSVSGTVSVGGSSAGLLRPGNSPGVMTFANLTLDKLSVTDMEIEGNAGAGASAAAGGFDQIVVTGKLALIDSSRLNILNSNTFELGLAQTVKLFAFAPGSVAGQFGTVTSQFGRSVAFNLATGSVVGLGSLSPAGFETAIFVNKNAGAMVNQLRVGSAGGVNQYYGGRLIEYAASALASGNPQSVAAVFDRASPEAYIGLMDHMKLSMLDNRLELGGYDTVDSPVFAMTGSIDLGDMKNRNREGFARYNSTDRRFNIGAVAHLPMARVQLSYGKTDGSVESDYLRSDVRGDQFSFGASVPVAFDSALRIAARVAYGDYAFRGNRVTNAGTTAFGVVKGSSTVFGGGFEYHRVTKKLTIDVATELLSVRNNVSGFSETGAGTLDNLSVNATSNRFAMASGDIRLGYELRAGMRGYLGLKVDHDFESTDQAMTANISVESVNVTVTNPGFSPTRVKASLGTIVDVANGVRWTLEGKVGNNSLHGGRTSVLISF
jgi:autotransporter-associated beta strand protein